MLSVKADYLFSYQPPVNLVALVIVLPSSYILTPRYFHKFNVFMIRVTNFPILLLIALYERQAKRHATSGFYDTISAILERIWDSLPRGLTKRIAFFDLAGSDADIDAVRCFLCSFGFCVHVGHRFSRSRTSLWKVARSTCGTSMLPTPAGRSRISKGGIHPFPRLDRHSLPLGGQRVGNGTHTLTRLCRLQSEGSNIKSRCSRQRRRQGYRTCGRE